MTFTGYTKAGADAALAAAFAALDLDDVPDSGTRKAFLTTERTKLTGIATGATANDTDVNLRDRTNHTGTQSADTLTDGTTNKAFLATERTKLTGIATAATANSSDATLLARANHTGTQVSTTISDFVEAVEDAVAALFARSTMTGITYTYNDSTGHLDASVSGVGGVDAEGARDAIAAAMVGVGVISVTSNDALDTITISSTATANSTDAVLLARANHTGTQSADSLTDGTTNKAFLATERTKLTGIATAATANSSDAVLLARANHTGTQSADSLTDGTTNKAFLATERTKLTGIATAATANSSDATLLARANHTGTQNASTIGDSTTIGRTILTATDAAAVKTALGIVPIPIRFSADTAVVGITGTDRASIARTLTGARMRAGGASAGSDLVVQIQHWNGTTWSTVATLTMTAGSTTEQTASFTQAQSIGHMVRLNVTSVGSTTAATDVVVDVEYS